MEILETFDLTQSDRDAAELAGRSPNTVADYVFARVQGWLTSAPAGRDQLVDSCADKLEEWLEASHAKMRADVVHDKLIALGYTAPKKAYRVGRRPLHWPWVPEPGIWAQLHWCDGPEVGGVRGVAVLCLADLEPLPGPIGRDRQGGAHSHRPLGPVPAPLWR